MAELYFLHHSIGNCNIISVIVTEPKHDKFMAKRILIFEDRLSSMNQISSDHFHFYSILEFPEIVSFVYSQEIDLLIIKGKSNLKHYPKILELAEAKANGSFPIAICCSKSEEPEEDKLHDQFPLIPFFSVPSSQLEWNNLSRLIIMNFQNKLLSNRHFQNEILQKEKRNARLERELSTRYFIDYEKILDVQNLVSQLNGIEELDEEVEAQLKKIKVMLGRLIRLDRTWKKFVQHFEMVCPSFIKTLANKHPQLSQNDLRLCVFLKIGITNKEISIASNINEGSVRKSLNRMKKKMNLGIEDDLRLYILMVDG